MKQNRKGAGCSPVKDFNLPHDSDSHLPHDSDGSAMAVRDAYTNSDCGSPTAAGIYSLTNILSPSMAGLSGPPTLNSSQCSIGVSHPAYRSSRLCDARVAGPLGEERGRGPSRERKKPFPPKLNIYVVTSRVRSLPSLLEPSSADFETRSSPLHLQLDGLTVPTSSPTKDRTVLH